MQVNSKVRHQHGGQIGERFISWALKQKLHLWLRRKILLKTKVKLFLNRQVTVTFYSFDVWKQVTLFLNAQTSGQCL